MTDLCQKILSDERLALLAFAGISAAALGTAFIAQYGYGLAPCELCIYQRLPYAFVIGFALIGVSLSHKSPKIGPLFLALTCLAFLTNTVFAAYHTGVERKWWPSFLEGCSIPELKGSITDVLAQIQAAPLVRCDEIPWTDPVLGLSMANYNVAVCLALAIIAGIAFCRSVRK